MKSDKLQIGREGEALAKNYLVKQGFRIVGQNMRNCYGEVDLVARKNNGLYFVEIRRKTGPHYGSAIESIDEQKARRMEKVAQALLSEKRGWQKFVPYISVLTIDDFVAGKTRVEFFPNAIDC